LHQRHEYQLRQKERERRCCHPAIEVHDIGQYGKQYTGLKQRLGEAAPDKPSDRLDFRHDHCGPDPARFGSQPNRLRRPRISDHVPTQIPRGILTDPRPMPCAATIIIRNC